MEILAIFLFLSIFILILYGYPVAITMGGLSALYAICFLDPTLFGALPPRILGVMSNYVLLAVPLFVFMGIMLEKSGLAEGLLESMAMLLGSMNGGLAYAVIIVGALLAASTGIVGATVITMGLISLPTMLKRNYKTEISTGTIAASGTLGQIIPPSIVLILLGSVLNVSVGKMFAAAILPGLGLVLCYLSYIFFYTKIHPGALPPIPVEERRNFLSGNWKLKILKAFLLPFLLILAVLGTIFWGIASPTEAAAIGAIGATLLTVIQKKISWNILKTVSEETTKITSMVFLILLGATTFSFVFREMGGDRYLIDLIEQAGLGPKTFLLITMLLVFICGFFIDFIEIIFIIVPVVTPIFLAYEPQAFSPVFQNSDQLLLWLGILLAMNLQTSFLSPPFGFSLFYLKGVAPPEVTTGQLYRGIIPFVLIQLIFLFVLILFPNLLFLFAA